MGSHLHSSPPRPPGRPSVEHKPSNLGFAVRLMGGRAFLVLADRWLDGVCVRHLSLEIPDLTFPFDVTGGAERFRDQYCQLHRFAARMDSAAIAQWWDHKRLAAVGIDQFELQCNHGFVVLRGFCSVAGDQVPFTCKATLLPTSDHHLHVLFYDSRFYGPCGISAAHLPALLYQALPPDVAEQSSASLWRVAPTRWLLRQWLPPMGWKVPEITTAPYFTVQITPQGLSLAAAEDIVLAEEESTPTPHGALFAKDGITTHQQAEQAIAAGDIAAAYDSYREIYEEGEGSAFVIERLLQLGLSLPAWHQELMHLLDEQEPHHGQHPAVLHGRGMLAMARSDMAAAMAVFERLAQVCREQRDKWGALAAEMAMGFAAEQLQPQVAIDAYRNAIAKGAQAPRLFERVAALCGERQDHEGVLWALEKWIHVSQDVDEQGALHVRMGRVYLDQLEDDKKARVQFERALRLVPQQSQALEGLAEIYGRRKEPERAAMLLARLADLAERSASDGDRIAIQLRLARLWWHALQDGAHAIARLRQLLAVFPHVYEAKLLWAQITLAQNHLQQGLALLEEIVGHDEESDAPPAPLLLQSYMLLATYAPAHRWQQGLASQWLLRSLELTDKNPQHFRAEREALVRLAFAHSQSKGMEQVWQALQTHIHEPDLLGQLQLRLAESALQHGQPWSQVWQHLQPALLMFNRQEQAVPPHLEPGLASFSKPEAWLSERQNHWINLLGQAMQVYPEEREVHRLLMQVSLALPRQEQQGAALLCVVQQLPSLATFWPKRRGLLVQVLQWLPEHGAAAKQLVADAEQFGSLMERQEAWLLLAQALGPHQEGAQAYLRYVQLFGEDQASLHQALTAVSQGLQTYPTFGALWLEKSRRERLLQLDKESLATLEQGLLHAQPQDHVLLLRQLIEQLGQAKAHGEQVRHIATLAHQHVPLEHLLLPWLEHVPLLGTQGEEAQQLLQRWAAQGLVTPGMGQLGQAYLQYRSGDHAGGRQGLLRLAKAALPEPSAPMIGALWEPLTPLGSIDRCQALELQIQGATGSLALPLLRQQLQAAMAAQASDIAYQAAQHILLLEPHESQAHAYLADWCTQHHKFEQALDHGVTALQSHATQATKPSWWLSLWRSTMALSLSLATHHRAGLRQWVQDQSAPLPLHEQLAQAGRWSDWLPLQQARLSTLPLQEQPPLARQLGLVLVQHLNQPEAAMQPLQFALASQPTDEVVFAELVKLYEQSSQWERLAALYFTLAHMHPEPLRSQQLALRSSQLYGERLQDRDRALEACQFIASQSPILVEQGLCEQLERYQAQGLLCEVLRRSWVARPAFDDGRWQRYMMLLAGAMAQPVQAWQMAQEACLQDPAAQAPWQVQDDLLQSHPSLGDRQQLLRAWADARVGHERATLLMALAELYLGSGEIQGQLVHLEQRRTMARQVLQEALLSDGQHVPLVERLSQLCVAQGDFSAAAHMYKTAIEHLPPGLERDSCIRSLLHVVGELQERPQDALWALGKLSQASANEQAWEMELLLELGHWQQMVEQRHRLSQLPVAKLWQAGALLAQHEQFAVVEQVATLLLAEPERYPQVWHTLSAWFPTPQGKVLLGRFRLQWLLQHPQPQFAWLRLAAIADLAEGGEPPVGLSAAALAPICEQLDRNDVEQLWHWLRAGAALQERVWVQQSLAWLVDKGPLEREKIYQGTLMAARLAFAAKDYEESLRLSQQLASAGYGPAIDLLEQSLLALHRKDALLAMLQQQFAAQQGYAPALLQRLVLLASEAGAMEQAAAYLQQLHLSDWTGPIALAAWQLGFHLEQYPLAASAAQVLAQLASSQPTPSSLPPPNPAAGLPGWLPQAHQPELFDQAGWLRQAGMTMLWWLKDQESYVTLGHQLLEQAQQHNPWTGVWICQLQQQLPQSMHAWWLDIGLRHVSGTQRLPVLLARMQWAIAATQGGGAAACQLAPWPSWQGELLDCFAQVQSQADQNLWLQVLAALDVPTALEQRGLLLQQWYQQAPSLAGSYYLAHLKQQGDSPQLRQLLQQQAERLRGAQAGACWQELAQLHLLAQEEEQACTCWERAYLASQQEDHLLSWLLLAARLQRHEVLLAQGESWLAHQPLQGPHAPLVARALIQAQTAQGLDSTPWRQRLIAAGFGTYEDKLYVVEQQVKHDPQTAAQQLLDLAQAHQGVHKAELLERAAFAHTQAGQVEGALQACEAALAAGGDSPGLHRLLLILPSAKSQQLQSMERLLALCQAHHPQTQEIGDKERWLWTMALAEDALTRQAWLQAEQWLSPWAHRADARWVHCFEQALQGQDKQIALAWLWQQHGALLSPEQRPGKLYQAAQCLAQQGEVGWQAAMAALTTCLQHHPGDGPSLAYMVTLAQLHPKGGQDHPQDFPWQWIDQALWLEHVGHVPHLGEQVTLVMAMLDVLLSPMQRPLPAPLAMLALKLLSQQFEIALWLKLRCWLEGQSEVQPWLLALQQSSVSTPEQRYAWHQALAEVGRRLPADEQCLANQLALIALAGSRFEEIQPALAYLERHAIPAGLGNMLYQAYQTLGQAHQGEQAATWWLKAGKLAQETLNDLAKASQAMVMAARQSPTMPFIEEGIKACLAQGDEEQASLWLMEGQLPKHLEWSLGQALLAVLPPLDKRTSSLQAWLYPRHPQTGQAAQFALQQARAGQQTPQVYQALAQLLTLKDHGLSVEEQQSLGLEWVMLALELAKWPVVLSQSEALLAQQLPLQTAQALLIPLSSLWLAPPTSALGDGLLALGCSHLALLADVVAGMAVPQEGAMATWLLACYQHLGQLDHAVSLAKAMVAQEILPMHPVQQQLVVACATAVQDYELLALTYAKLARHQTGEEQGNSYWLAGLACQQGHHTTQQHLYWQQALACLPEDGAKQAMMGQWLLQQEQPQQALPYLLQAVERFGESASLSLLDDVLACHRALEQVEQVVAVGQRCIQLAPQSHERWRELAHGYGRLERWREEREAWRQVLQWDPGMWELGARLTIQQRIAKLSELLGEQDVALQDWLAVLALDGTHPETLAALAALYQRMGALGESYEIAWQQLLLQTPCASQAEEMVQLAQKMGQMETGRLRCLEMLEQAAELFPRHPAVLQALADRYDPKEDRAPWLLAMERWIGCVGAAKVPLAQLEQCALAYQAIDVHRAKDLWQACLQQQPRHTQAMAQLAAIGHRLGDMELYNHYEGQLVLAMDKGTERGERSKALGERLWQGGGLAQEALPWLLEACQQLPPEQAPWLSLAQLYASEKTTYRKAVELYRQLWAAHPLDGRLLRTMARLWRHLGEVDRTWQAYAALLCLDPSDGEANSVVKAFRASHAFQLHLPVERLEQAPALLHRQQGGLAEDLYIPLARLVERAVGMEELARKGIGEGQRRDRSRSDMVDVAQICTWVGCPDLPIYTWPGRAYHVEYHLGPTPGLLVGELLWGEGDSVARRFLLLRTLLLYRSGYTLPTRVDKTYLEGLLAALASALLGPEVAVPYAKPAVVEAIRPMLQPKLVGQCQPVAKQFVLQQQSLDIRRWQVASRSTANRLAMLISCDVALAVDTLFRMHGFEDLLPSQRQALLQSAAEELDLFRFALSEEWFQLRSELQMAPTTWPEALQEGLGPIPLHFSESGSE